MVTKVHAYLKLVTKAYAYLSKPNDIRTCGVTDGLQNTKTLFSHFTLHLKKRSLVFLFFSQKKWEIVCVCVCERGGRVVPSKSGDLNFFLKK